MNEDELNEKLLAELGNVLFPDENKRAMELANAKNEMADFIEGLSDSQLSLISKMVGMKKGQDKLVWFSGVQQWAGMLYYEELRRNRAKQFAELPKRVDDFLGGASNA